MIYRGTRGRRPQLHVYNEAAIPCEIIPKDPLSDIGQSGAAAKTKFIA